MSSPIRRAKRGHKILKEFGASIGYVPGRVDRRSLDMAHGHSCVIGQGSEMRYSDAIRRLYRASEGLGEGAEFGRNDLDSWVIENGFDSDDQEQSALERQNDLRLLTSIWGYLLLRDELAAA